MASLELCKREEVRGFGASWLVADKSASEEEGVSDEIIVEVIVDLRPQLGNDIGICRGRHDAMQRSGQRKTDEKAAESVTDGKREHR